MTEKQKRFADEYLIDLNATRAYRAAYPAVRRDETAAVNASKLLRNTRVSAYISERMEDRRSRTEITQDQVLQELAAIAFSKVTDIVSVCGNTVVVRDTADLTEEQKKAIAGIKEGKNGIEIKMNDKEKALELLGRHMGMWNDKLEVSGLEAEKSKLDELIRQMDGGAP